MACDNIVSATMVLASGEIVKVSESENSDLLWGIKGGGCNDDCHNRNKRF